MNMKVKEAKAILEVQQNKIITVKELCDFMKIGKNTAYKLIKLKGFPAFRIGNKILISQNKLQKWIDDNCGSNIII